MKVGKKYLKRFHSDEEPRNAHAEVHKHKFARTDQSKRKLERMNSAEAHALDNYDTSQDNDINHGQG